MTSEIITSKECTFCHVVKSLGLFSPSKKGKYGRNSECKQCGAERKRARYATHREEILLTCAKWRKNNPEKAAESCKNSFSKNYQKNKSKISARGKLWKSSNKDKVNASYNKRRAKKLNATPIWLSDEQLRQIRLYYTLAQKLSKINLEEYHVDHIVPLQGKNVCGLHVPWNLQVIPGCENTSKGNRLAKTD